MPRPDLAPYHKTFKNTRLFNVFGRNISKTHCFLMIYAFQVCQCFHNDPGHVFIVERHIVFFNYFYANAPSVLGSRFAYWKIFCISGPRVPPVSPVTSRFSQRPDLAPYHKTFKNTMHVLTFSEGTYQKHTVYDLCIPGVPMLSR